jgi:PleD family two-component response regulator
VSVHASLGVAFLELDSKGSIDGDTLCKQADSAMYMAKTEKNTWRFFEPIKPVPDDLDDLDITLTAP